MGVGIFILWLILVVATGGLAASKNRSVAVWVLLAVLFAPAVIVILAVLPAEDVEDPTRPRVSQTKACPFCAERIKIEARVCKHCGRDLPIRPTDEGDTSSSEIVELEDGGFEVYGKAFLRRSDAEDYRRLVNEQMAKHKRL